MFSLVKEIIHGPLWIGLICAWFGAALMTQITRDLLLKVELEATVPGFAKVYYRDAGGFSEGQAIQQYVFAQGPQTLWFRLPTSRVDRIRFDPIDQDATIRIHDIRWSEPWPGRKGALDPTLAKWEGAFVRNSEKNVFEIETKKAEIPDPYAVWTDKIGWTSFEWRVLRISAGVFIGLLSAILVFFWNRSILYRRNLHEKSVET